MSLYDFIFGKTTYKGDQHFLNSGLLEESVELAAWGGRCLVYFNDEGAKRVGLELPPGTYRLFLATDWDEEFICELTSNGQEKILYLPVSVALIKKAELLIRCGQEEERVPLW